MGPEPLPGVIIVEIGDPPGVLPPAAKLADVVAESRRTNQREIHIQACLPGQDPDVERYVVDSDGVRCRIEGHQLPAQGQEGGDMVALYLPKKSIILTLDPAVCDLFLLQGEQVQKGIKGFSSVVKYQLQQGKIQHLMVGKGLGDFSRFRKESV
jgi:hypothetical protein